MLLIKQPEVGWRQAQGWGLIKKRVQMNITKVWSRSIFIHESQKVKGAGSTWTFCLILLKQGPEEEWSSAGPGEAGGGPLVCMWLGWYTADFWMAKQTVAWPNETQEEEEGIPGGILRQNLPGLRQIKESRYFVTTLWERAVKTSDASSCVALWDFQRQAPRDGKAKSNTTYSFLLKGIWDGWIIIKWWCQHLEWPF